MNFIDFTNRHNIIIRLSELLPVITIRMPKFFSLIYRELVIGTCRQDGAVTSLVPTRLASTVDSDTNAGLLEATQIGTFGYSGRRFSLDMVSQHWHTMMIKKYEIVFTRTGERERKEKYEN